MVFGRIKSLKPVGKGAGHSRGCMAQGGCTCKSGAVWTELFRYPDSETVL